ncbi:MAG: hypothetical protein M5U34_18190 [Chloroflexi bacterium]|nr:hypothetical protein [Chloroflexota bacterium]
MKAMSRFTRVFWLLSAAVLLLLINLQTAAQPDAPPPIDEILAQPVAPPPPQAMSYQPPAETSLVADLMPPQTVLVQPNITVPEVDSFDPGSMLTLNSPAQTIPLPLATDTAVSLIDERLTLVVEQDTFDAPVNLAVRSLAVLPVPDETAETSDEPAAYDAAPFMRFALDMLDEKGQPIESFAKNVRLVVDVRDYGIDKAEEGGEFYLAYENPQQPGEWLETSLTAHDSHGLISAEVSHFSNWEAGWRPNGWTFQWQPPTPDPYTGAAVYSYPFNLPPGRNGLAPAVSLNYSSSGLRGFSNRGSGWGRRGHRLEPERHFYHPHQIRPGLLRRRIPLNAKWQRRPLDSRGERSGRRSLLRGRSARAAYHDLSWRKLFHRCGQLLGGHR